MKKITILFVLTFILFVNHSFSQQVNGTNSPKVDSANSQKIDSAKKDFYLKAASTITNKGISYIPNFSLGKPAIIFDLSMGNGKLFFEPQLRFSLMGEPWAFLFPVRYKLKSKGKFQMTLCVNPLMNFKNVTYTVKGVSTTDLVNRRYLGGEFRPNYLITKNISIGALYLYFRGVSNGAIQNTNFVSVNTNFSDIKLGSTFFTKINAQFYYLNQGGFDGFYFNPALTLSKRKFPFSVQTMMNLTIDSNIPGNQKLIWNVSLIYAFNKTYIPK